VGFIYFGSKLYLETKKTSTNNTNTHKKLFWVTTVCSCSFILHCIFILVLAGLSEPNIWFSFFGLIITEIVPSVFVIVTFWRLKRETKSSRTANLSSSGSRAETEMHQQAEANDNT